ncbi:hypothetical protein SAMN05414139_09472 [Burkholderia sp. D7]|nr:hypothetical protein SAMN05414139_09472 [Burkholderia sp. D7]
MNWESSFDGYLEHLCEALEHNLSTTIEMRA